jgi:hypothetical protein
MGKIALKDEAWHGNEAFLRREAVLLGVDADDYVRRIARGQRAGKVVCERWMNVPRILREDRKLCHVFGVGYTWLGEGDEP